MQLVLATHPAQAQTVRRSAAQQDADQRRAQREASRLESPYKDSHLQPGRRLGRGEGDQPHPQGSDPLHFENGKHPRAVKAKSAAARHQRKSAPARQ